MPDLSPDDALSLAAQRAYATWFRLTNPLAGVVVPPWHLLEPATRALWVTIARAARQDDD